MGRQVRALLGRGEGPLAQTRARRISRGLGGPPRCLSAHTQGRRVSQGRLEEVNSPRPAAGGNRNWCMSPQLVRGT